MQWLWYWVRGFFHTYSLEISWNFHTFCVLPWMFYILRKVLPHEMCSRKKWHVQKNCGLLISNPHIYGNFWNLFAIPKHESIILQYICYIRDAFDRNFIFHPCPLLITKEKNTFDSGQYIFVPNIFTFSADILIGKHFWSLNAYGSNENILLIHILTINSINVLFHISGG